MAKSLSCGCDFTCVPDLVAAMESAGQDGFDFIQVPLIHPLFKRDSTSRAHRPGPLTRSDMILTSKEWTVLVVAKLSPWIQLESSNTVIRRNSEEAFFEELSLAVHLSVPAVLISLRSHNCLNLARCLNKQLLSHHNQSFWIKVPLVSCRPQLEALEVQQGDQEEEMCEDPWEWWNRLRILCHSNSKLGLVLEVGSVLPSSSHQLRWLGEPVKTLTLSTDIFIPNKKGFPVLPKRHQEFVTKAFKLNVQVIITGYPKSHYGIKAYFQYLDHLHKNQPPPTLLETFSKGFEDYLQSPLQPLMDNLDSSTYEIFEKDPVKYTEYQKAIKAALLDRVPDDAKDTVISVVMVVGAGRGPLVDATLKAAASAGRKVKVFAVEKNPGAVNTLQNRQVSEWGEGVTVVPCDMREWKPTEKADILVSELLGSFGDNELSPECLNGAQTFLKSDGVSIPCAYTSYLAPVSSAKLHAEISVCKDKEKAYPFHQFEIPYVVYLLNNYSICQPHSCFSFDHPNWKKPIDNSRYACLQFTSNTATTLHGFAGYFDTNLYDGIMLSTEPSSYSEGMISWFPILFPLRNPVYVPAGGEIEVHMWRVCAEKKVWYEWCLTKPLTTPIHNPNGRSYWIGL